MNNPEIVETAITLEGVKSPLKESSLRTLVCPICPFLTHIFALDKLQPGAGANRMRKTP